MLVVEDDRLTLGLLAEILTQSGFVVGAAATAADARRMWDQMDPDAVVLDVDLGPDAIAAMSNTQLAALTPSQAAALTDAQRAALTPAQRRLLPT